MLVILRLAALALAVYTGWWLWERYRPVDSTRPVLYQKGTYSGQADTPLAQPQTEALSQRAAGQRY